MENIVYENCVPCRRGDTGLDEEQIQALSSVISGWKVYEINGIPRLERVFTFKNFVKALEFTNKIGELAEEQDHHPALLTEWGKVTVTWWTHAVGGLHRNDFIMAARTEVAYGK